MERDIETRPIAPATATHRGRAPSALLVSLGVLSVILDTVLRGPSALVGLGLAGLAVSAAILLGLKTHRPRYPWAWRTLIVTATAFLGAWGLTGLSLLRHHFDLYLLPAVLIVTGCATLVYASTVFARRQRGAWDRGSLVEVLMVIACAAAPTAALLVLPDINVHDLPAYMNGATDLLPLGVVSMAVLLLRVMVWSGERSPAASLMLAAVVVMSIASVGLALAGPPDLQLSTTALIAALVLVGLAALQPSMTHLTEPAFEKRQTDGTVFAVVALLVPVLTLAARWVIWGRFDFATFLSIELVITTLVVWRVRLLFTAARRARLTAENSEEYYRTVLDNVADLIVALDADGNATYVSPSAGELLGLQLAELTGGRALDAVHPADQDMAAALLDQAISIPGHRVNGELRVVTAEGAVRCLAGSATSLVGHHGDAAVVIALHDITEQKRLEDELAHRAMHDEMTRLPNRGLIRDRCDQMLAHARRSGNRVAALFIDLDGFKGVNDTLGHAAGDALLVAVAARLVTGIRASDTVGRIGGDEFVVLTEDDAAGPGPELVAERVLELLREPFHLEAAGEGPILITASIGIAEGPRPAADDLLRDADVAMYRAKVLGKARYVSFEPEMFSAMKQRVELELDLRSALESEQFFLLYQPTVDLASLEVTGVEALIRWRHPARGVVPPLEFIPMLEETGAIIEIGRWVLREACTQAAAWQRQGRVLTMSVNVSARQLESDALIDDVREALQMTRLRPERLTLEITETTLMHDADKTAGRLERLRALGVRIAIDDFGTGYCSFAYLKRFPIDILKIDRSFVADLSDSEDARTLVRTLVRLGTDLGLVTLAEGIEDGDQLEELRRQHCAAGQGYLFARPLEPAALEELLQAPLRVETSLALVATSG
jgi:diguanylate cyclase (GGDEF)-like protein/PAS domain S-box-containing protein